MCPSVENSDLVYQKTGDSQGPTHPRPAECGSRQAIQARPDHSVIVVSPSKGLPVNMQQVVLASKISICNEVQQQVYLSLFHQYRIPWHGQWTHSACHGKIWMHMPSHQWPFWAKWWRSYKAIQATESF